LLVTLGATLDKLAFRLVHLTRLRRRRLEKGWTLKHLSELTGLSLQTLSSLERGTREPRPATITLLARVLECQPIEMMEPERL
jgi:transcriptional regulator with XRE-family HTH domain